jgi:hypothetical protein
MVTLTYLAHTVCQTTHRPIHQHYILLLLDDMDDM